MVVANGAAKGETSIARADATRAQRDGFNVEGATHVKRG